MAVLDAYGRPVEELGVCERCGAYIKYIYIHDGKTYGSTCIEAVSGIHPDEWIWKGDYYDESATRKSLAEKEATRLDYIARNKALDEKREITRQINRTKFAELINVLNNYMSDFTSDMARNIANDGSSNDLNSILSDRQFQIVREIWGKRTGGRMNTKAYNVAIAEFDAKFEKGGLAQ